MKPIPYILLLALGAGCAAHQAPPVASTTGQPSSSRSSTPAYTPTEASVRAHMEFLASDAMNGRGSATRDEWIAATYVAAQLRRWGIEPLGDDGGYVQAIEIERAELAAPPVLSIGNTKFTHGAGFTMFAMTAPASSGPLATYQKGVAVPKGAVVIVPQLTPELQPEVAQAVLVLAPEGKCGRLPAPQRPLPRLGARTLGVSSVVRPPCASLGADALKAAQAAPAGTTVSLDGEVKNVQRARTWNAVGQLKGSDPTLSSQVILLSAHIDHEGTGRGQPKPGADSIYNGADDDASGSIAILELAQSLASGPRPKRTVVFAWFGSEESGGAGSRFFADKPVVPLDAITANLQFEMIGRPDAKVPPHTLWLTGYERSTLGPELAKRGAKLVQDPHPEQGFFERSDNIQFARRGVIAHTVSSFGLHKEYHQPSDEIRLIDFAHMTDSIRSMLEPIRWLADSNFKPEWLPGKKP